MDLTQRIIQDIRDSWKKALNNDFENVRTKREKAIDFYENRQIKHLTEYMESRNDTRGETPMYTFSNITRKVINGISLTYINKPVRMLNEDLDDNYTKWTRDKDRVMLEADRYTSLLDYVGVKVEWDDDRNKYKYRLIKHDIYFRLDKYGEDVEAVWFSVIPQGQDAKKNTIMYEYWDKENKYIVDTDGRKSKFQALYGFEDDKNPYGLIPVEIISKNDFLAEDLIIANEVINADLTLLNELIKYRSFGQMYIAGYSGEGNTIKISYKDILTMSDPNAKAGMVELKTDIMQVVESIKWQIQNICEMYGVSVNWSLEGNPSGFSLLVQNIELYDNIKVDNDKRRQWEENIYRIEMAISKGKVKDFMIDFTEYKLPTNKQELVVWEQHLLATNQATPVMLMIEKNPDLTEERAKEIYEESLATKKANTQAQTDRPPTLAERINLQ